MVISAAKDTKPLIETYQGLSRRSQVQSMAPSSPDFRELGKSNRANAADRQANSTVASKQSAKTSKVLLDATRDFGCIQRPARDEIDQYKELFYQLIERVPANEKRLISAMLARGVFTPRPVALYLAQDRCDIAAPFLLYSPVLGDLDLRAIAKKKGGEHAAIIAKRRLPMDAYTVSTLHDVISGPSDTIEAKPETFVPELEEITQTVPTVVEAASVTDQRARWLEGEEILALASVGGRLGRKDKKLHAEVSEQQAIDTASQTSRPCFTLPKTETRKLMQFARLRDFEALSAYVEELCGLESSATLKLIYSQQGTELVYLIKALGMSSPHDIQTLLMLVPQTGRHITQYQETKKMLGELDAGICRIIFNEIGARFAINHDIRPTVDREDIATAGFSQAIQRRRDSLEAAPHPRKLPVPKGQFSFERSFLATG